MKIDRTQSHIVIIDENLNSAYVYHAFASNKGNLVGIIDNGLLQHASSLSEALNNVVHVSVDEATNGTIQFVQGKPLDEVIGLLHNLGYSEQLGGNQYFVEGQNDRFILISNRANDLNESIKNHLMNKLSTLLYCSKVDGVLRQQQIFENFSHERVVIFKLDVVKPTYSQKNLLEHAAKIFQGYYPVQCYLQENVLTFSLLIPKNLLDEMVQYYPDFRDLVTHSVDVQFSIMDTPHQMQLAQLDEHLCSTNAAYSTVYDEQNGCLTCAIPYRESISDVSFQARVHHIRRMIESILTVPVRTGLHLVEGSYTTLVHRNGIRKNKVTQLLRESFDVQDLAFTKHIVEIASEQVPLLKSDSPLFFKVSTGNFLITEHVGAKVVFYHGVANGIRYDASTPQAVHKVVEYGKGNQIILSK